MAWHSPRTSTPAQYYSAYIASTCSMSWEEIDIAAKLEDERKERQVELAAMHELFQQVGGPDIMTTVRAVENLNSTVSSLSAAVSSLQSGTGNGIETPVASPLSANNVILHRIDDLSTATSCLSSAISDIGGGLDAAIQGHSDLRTSTTLLQQPASTYVKPSDGTSTQGIPLAPVVFPSTSTPSIITGAPSMAAPIALTTTAPTAPTMAGPVAPNTAVPNAPAAPSAVTSAVPTPAVPPAPSTLGPVRTSGV
ncbi:hypothetical protein GYMLUDRAFT_251729 [Collybiopsis luxurians FD-317 M1]|uniref:Unplaced genomic scaffold GYMLUscaffold_106, whole genome shotgun sequence n=1 Tax=Collybiopsis luxurians FD-317 M1 TaxID=944289 RepID=A0A0D0BBQ8_9AGAR|nr:hypothetical protein GYMLUDRAFT_251729 [Collybiopsis luxurians FD-317 M1]